MPLLRRFSKLHWKLVVSYVLVTLLTVLVLEITVLLGMHWFGDRLVRAWMGRQARPAAEQLARAVAGAMDARETANLEEILTRSDGLTIQIATSRADSGRTTRETYVRVLVSPSGTVVATTAPVRLPAGSAFADPTFRWEPIWSTTSQLESDTKRLRELADRNERLAKQTQRVAALEERHRLAQDLHVTLYIRDDGRGFDPNAVKRDASPRRPAPLAVRQSLHQAF